MNYKHTNHDPKLKEAAEEIKIILKKYDAQAAMLLVSPSHCEYLYFLDSSWSTARFEPATDKHHPNECYLRFRSKKEDFKNKEDQHFATEATMHGITSMLQFGRMTSDNMQKILEVLKQHMKIAYEVWD